MTKENNLLPINMETQIEYMKSYVHFVKKIRMTVFLRKVGYFRCSRYGKFLISHANVIGTKPTQDMLFQIYSLDTQLRKILFHYCQVAEIQVKTYLADSISLKLNNAAFYSNHQHYTPSRSERDKVKKQSNMRFFKTFFQNLMEDASALIKKSRKYPELKEYRKGGSKETNIPPCWVLFSYMELGTVVNIYAYLRGDLRNYVLKYGYSRKHYGKKEAKCFDTWLEALRNLRNICAHHNILVGKTSSVVLPEAVDAETLVHDTDLFSRLYALKKLLPLSEHTKLKHEIYMLIKHSKIDVLKLGIFPADWEKRYDSIKIF